MNVQGNCVFILLMYTLSYFTCILVYTILCHDVYDENFTIINVEAFVLFEFNRCVYENCVMAAHALLFIQIYHVNIYIQTILTAV